MTVANRESAELFDAFEKAEIQEVRKLARQHTRAAVETLVRLMKAPKTPPGVKRQCATDILSQGWGRPDSRADGGEAVNKGITINILKLSTGVVETIGPQREIADSIIEAVDVARFIAAENDRLQNLSDMEEPL